MNQNELTANQCKTTKIEDDLQSLIEEMTDFCIEMNIDLEFQTNK